MLLRRSPRAHPLGEIHPGTDLPTRRQAAGPELRGDTLPLRSAFPPPQAPAKPSFGTGTIRRNGCPPSSLSFTRLAQRRAGQNLRWYAAVERLDTGRPPTAHDPSGLLYNEGRLGKTTSALLWLLKSLSPTSAHVAPEPFGLSDQGSVSEQSVEVQSEGLATTAFPDVEIHFSSLSRYFARRMPSRRSNREARKSAKVCKRRTPQHGVAGERGLCNGSASRPDRSETTTFHAYQDSQQVACP